MYKDAPGTDSGGADSDNLRDPVNQPIDHTGPAIVIQINCHLFHEMAVIYCKI